MTTATAQMVVEIMMMKAAPIDKIVALVLVLRAKFGLDPANPKELERLDIKFEHLHKDLLGKIPDIDISEKYHFTDAKGKKTYRAGSATELEARRHGVQNASGMAAVIADVNANNNGGKVGDKQMPGGWLKQLPYAFADLVREMYEFGHLDDAEAAADPEDDAGWRQHVIKEFLPITAWYLDFHANLPPEPTPAVRKEAREEFEGFFPQFKGKSEHPLTLCGQAWWRYLEIRTVNEAGDVVPRSEEELQGLKEWVENWVPLFEHNAELEGETKKQVEALLKEAKLAEIQGGLKVVFLNDVRNPKTAKHVFRLRKDVDLIVVRGPQSLVILPSMKGNFRRPMEKLFHELYTVTGYQCYKEERAYGGRAPQIMFGSRMMGSVSQLNMPSDEELQELIRRFFPHKRKENRKPFANQRDNRHHHGKRHEAHHSK